MIFYQQNNDIQVEVREFIKNERVCDEKKQREMKSERKCRKSNDIDQISLWP